MMEINNLEDVEWALRIQQASLLYNRPHVIVQVPTLQFDGFKGRVLGTYFGGDCPWFVKHVKSSNDEYTMATFSSDDGEDINTVLSMLPAGSSFSFAKGC